MNLPIGPGREIKSRHDLSALARLGPNLRQERQAKGAWGGKVWTLDIGLVLSAKGLKWLQQVLEADEKIIGLEKRMSNVQGLLPKWF